MRNLLHHLIGSLESGREVLSCRLVVTRGSTPQKAGASMLLTPDGGQIGTLGGGCVEASVKQRAAGLLGKEGAEVYRFVLDHDPEWADGLICGGKMVVLAESPKGASHLAYSRAMMRLLDAGRGFTEVISLDPERSGVPVGERFLFDHDGTPFASLGGGLPTEAIFRGVEPLDMRPRPVEKGGLAYLPTMARVCLVIVGAGHVGQAVADLAVRSDFDVWVVDDRPQYANSERFPHAQRRIVGPIGEVLRSLEITPRTYALIVTRGHGHDQEALGLLAPTSASYVGMIGSRRKIKVIFEALREQGLAESALARVAAPVGLDIGSETVEEIAVSIMAELIALRNRGVAGLQSLRSATGWSAT